MFFRLKMWNNHGQCWPEDQSWLNASPFGQYSQLGSVQPSWLSQTHPLVSTRTVSPVPESRSISPVSFCSEGSVSVDSDDRVSNHLAVNSVNANRRNSGQRNKSFNYWIYMKRGKMTSKILKREIKMSGRLLGKGWKN